MRVRNTFIMWGANFAPQLGIALIFAIWFTDLRLNLKCKGVFRAVFYMPNLLTTASIAILFRSLFAYPIGPVNQFLTGTLNIWAEGTIDGETVKQGFNFFRIGGFSGFGGGAFGRAGLGLGAGCFGLGTSSAERNDHHSHKQQRKDLFHFLNLLFYFALLPAPPVRISLGARRSKNITSFASGLSRSVHRMIPRDSISRQVSIRLFVRFAGFSRLLFLTFYAYLFQHATK